MTKVTYIILILTTSVCSIKTNVNQYSQLKLYDTYFDNKMVNSIADVENDSTLQTKIIKDPKVFQLFNKFKKIEGEGVIWKGAIYGKLESPGKDPKWIAISVFGSFYKEVSTGQYYELTDKTYKDEWDNLVDDFIEESKREHFKKS